MSNRKRPALDAAPDLHETGGTQHGLQLPRWIWLAMLGCYAISIGYAVMYFGTAALLNSLKGPEHPSPLNLPGGHLDTWCGPMDLKSVASQVLGIPVAFAIFGIAICIVRLSIGV